MAELEPVLSEGQIGKRVRELGAQLTQDYAGRHLMLIGILNGAFVFLADLMRVIELPLEVEFFGVASYGASDTSSGTIRITKDTERSVEGVDVLLVEDIVDTGRTVAFLKEVFLSRGARSVKICALIDKEERRAVPIDVDYRGFRVQEGFLVGYGLDYAQQHRRYSGVFQLKTGD